MNTSRNFWSVLALALSVTFACETRGAQLIHRYGFQGASVTDLVGASDGTLFGNAVVSNGKLVLDGAASYVEFANPIIPSSGTWTLAFSAQQTASQLGSYMELVSGGGGLYIGHDPAGRMRFSDSNSSTSVPFPSDGLVHHYAWVQGPANGQFYLDGVLVGTFNSMTPTAAIRLSRQYNGHAEYLVGSMQDVRVYAGMLSASELASLAAGANGCVAAPPGLVSSYKGENSTADASGTHAGTAEGGLAYAAAQVGNGFVLNGSNAALDVGGWFNQQAFSIGFWVRSGASQGDSATLLDNNQKAAASWSLKQDGANLNQYVWSAADGSSPVSVTWPAETWAYVLVTRDPAHVNRVYVNGALAGFSAGTGPIAYDGSQRLRVGRWGGGARFWQGAVDELDIYDRALTEREVLALFSAGAAGKCLSLPPSATVPYAANFESGMGAEWSLPWLDATETASFSRFAGRFSNHAEILTLTGLTPGASYTLGFDFYAMDSWDGNGGGDRFQVFTDNQLQFNETFSNYNGDPPSSPQSYAGQPDSGRVQLGFSQSLVDAIYRDLELPFVAAASTVQIMFRGSNLQDISDESWGIDNVVVRATTVSTATQVVETSLPAEQGTVSVAVDRFFVVTSKGLNSNSAADPSNYVLREAGANGVLGDGDDQIIDLAPNLTGRQLNFTFNNSPLQPGRYRFELRNTLQDLNGQAVTAFSREFLVAHPLFGRIESTFNNQLETATPLTLVESPTGSGLFTAAAVGSFPGGGDTDYWRIEAQAGDRLTLWVESDSGNAYPQLYLQNAAGTTIAGSGEWSSSYNYIQNLAISLSGTYYVAVSSNNGRSRSGYSLRLDLARGIQLETEDNNNQNQATVLQVAIAPGVFHGRVAGALSGRDGTGDYFRLPMMTVGNTLNVSLSFPQCSSVIASDVVMSLEFEGGASVATSTNGNMNFVANADGVYYLRLAATVPGWRAQYVSDVTITDGSKPVITSIDLPAEGSAVTDIIDRFTLGFSEDMDPRIGLVGPVFSKFGGHVYRSTTSPMTWGAAEAEAVSLGGHLVAVNDAAENSYLATTFGTIWLGFTDEFQEGTFVWSNGDPVTFTSWSGGEPNNSGNEDYTQLYSNGAWNDLPGSSSLWGVVEWPNDTDTDGDGVPDLLDAFPNDPQNGFEIRSAGLDGQFGTADDRIYQLTSTGYSSGKSATFRIKDGPLQAGLYRLTINASVKDRAGNSLAVPVVRTFTVQSAPGFVLENQGNDARGLATSLSPAPASTADGSFQYQTAYGTGRNPYHVVSADLDRDGKLDLVTANISDSTVSVFLGNGDGTFKSQVTYATGSGAIAVAVADVNGDQVPDVVSANHNAHTVSVLLGNGDGTFQSAVNYGAGTNPRQVVIVDMNGDHHPDLLVANQSSGSVSLLLGAGDGTFAAATSFPAGSEVWGVAGADLNGDGKTDLVMTRLNPPAILVQAGHGDGTFEAPQTYTTGAAPREVVLADMNGDGKLDAVVMNAGDATVSILLGQGDGTFAAARNYPSSTGDPYHMVVGQFTADNRPDVAIGSYGSGYLIVMLNQGDGSLSTPMGYGLSGNPIAVAAGDFNADGRTDLAAVGYSNNALHVLFGNNLEPLQESPSGSGLRVASGRGRISDRSDVDYWSFSAHAGDVLGVAVESPGGATPRQLYFRVELPDGQVITDFYSEYTYGYGQSTPITLPVSGTYYVRVSASVDYFLEYRLRVALVKPGTSFERENNDSINNANGLGFTLTGHTIAATQGGYIGSYDEYGDYVSLGRLGGGSTITLGTRQPDSSGIKTSVSVFNSSGQMVARSAPGQSTVTYAVTPGAEGAYYGRVGAIRPGVVRFDGADDRIYAGYWNAGATWSVEAWVKASAVPNGRRTIAGGVNEARDWGLTMHDGQFGVLSRPTTGASSQTTRTGDPVELGRWYHLVGTCDGTTAQIYVDGVLKAGAPVDPNFIGTGSYFVIGSEACCGGNSFPGDIDQVRVWNRVLDGSEVAAHAADRAALLSGSESGLLANWTFDEGWGSTAYDLSPGVHHATLQNGAAFVPDEPAPAYPSLTGMYLLDVQIADSAAPQVLADSWPAEGSTNRIVIDRFSLHFSEDMIAETVTSPATYEIRCAGADKIFGTADDAVYTAACTGYTAGLDAAYMITDGPLQPGDYRFTVKTVLQDRGGNGLAANYVRSFVLENEPGYLVENRLNDTARNATSLSTARAATPAGSVSSLGSKGVGHYPYHVVSADLNRDGHLDLVTANLNDSNISVLLGKGDGTFQDQATYSAASGAIAVSVTDLNGDQIPDVVAANHYASSVTVFLGVGDGTFNAGVHYPVGSNPRQLSLADLNGDHHPDIVTANAGASSVSVLLGTGDGSFGAATSFPAGSDPWGVAVADLNGDGKPEIVVANQSPGTIQVLAGNGDGTFGSPQAYAAGSSSREVVLADMNGDGKLDAVVLNAGANTVSVLLGQGNGTFAAANAYAAGSSDPYHMVVASLTSDSLPDVAIGSYGSSALIIMQNQGDGTLGPGLAYSVPGNPIAVAAGDYNEDGRTDLATADHTGHHVWIWTGDDSQPLAENPSGSGVRSSQARGVISDGSDADYYSFTALANDRLSVAFDTVGNPVNSGLYYRVEYPSGATVGDFYATQYGWGQSSPVVLPVAGTYRLRVSFNWGYTGEYRARVTLARPPVQIETEDNSGIGNANSPTLAIDGSHQRATLLGYVSVGDTAGDFYRLGNQGRGTTISLGLRLPSDSPLVPVLTIYRSNGTAVTNSLPGELALSFTIGAGEEDTYLARVAPANGAPGSLLHQYLLDVDVADTQPPSITGCNLPDEGSAVTTIIDRFTLSYSEDMKPATVLSGASYDLRNAGGDGLFDTADDQVYAVASTGYASGLSGAYSITDGPLQAGSYRLTVLTGLQDRAGNGLAAPYVRRFTVNQVAGFVLENRGNNSLLAGTSLSPLPSTSPDGSVTPSRTYPVGAQPYAIATADLNGDGFADLVTANINGQTVTVLLGKGDGTFQDGVHYGVASGVISVAVGDVNGDHHLDLVSANYYSSTVSVLLGNGDGTFQSAANFPVGAGPRHLAVADLNGDGRADVVTANSDAHNATVYLANADGTLGGRRDIPTGQNCYGVAVGDLNQDGKPDVVTANQGNARASVLLGNNDGSFAAPVDYNAGSGARDVLLGDMDGDGKLDVVVLNAFANSISILAGNGDGTLKSAVDYPTGGNDPYHMALTDLNADGRLDVAVGSYGSDRMILLMNTGTGALGRPLNCGPAGRPIAVAAADFNRDGRIDLATANYSSSTVVIWLGNATQALAESPAGSGLRTGFGRGNITDGNDVDYWTFSAQANDRLSVAVETVGSPGSSSLYMQVQYGDGSVLTEFWGNNNGYGLSTPLVIPVAGTYRARVSFNHGFTGEYRIRVALARPPAEIETESNDSLGQANGLAFVDSPQTRTATEVGFFAGYERAGDFYSLGNLDAGTSVKLGARRQPDRSFGQMITLFQANGSVVGQLPPGANEFTTTVPTGGAYFVGTSYLLQGGPKHPGGTGVSLAFDGTSSYINPTIDVPENAMTLSLWFRTVTPGVGLFSVQGGGHDRHLYLTGGNLGCRVYAGGGFSSSGLNLADGRWRILPVI